MDSKISDTHRPFFQDDEAALVEKFLGDGYVIIPSEDKASLERIQRFLANKAADLLDLQEPEDATSFLDTIQDHIRPDNLNDFRLATYRALNDEPWVRPAYFSAARRAVETIVGNELAMQRRINLSIQLPNDDSSLLPVHADVWSGDSPYEIVLWIPMVDCFKTKSMFWINKDVDEEVQSRFSEFEGKTAEDLWEEIEPHASFLEIPFGSCLLFTQNVMHGNRLNLEPTTRWSMNCRFKSVMSPYSDKRLGEFFEPITLRPATRMGLNYKLPGGFKE